jgi:hypothetical protein
MSFQNPIIAAGLNGLSQLFEDRAVTPVEVCEAYLSRIERLDGALGAYNAVDADRARAEAHQSAERWAKGEPLSPIDGAPIGVKCNIAVEGLPWTAGIGAYRDRLAETDAPCVARLREAGALILGTLNMEEGHHRQSVVRPNGQSLEQRLQRGRIVRRLGRGGGCRPLRRGARLRHPGFGPHSLELLRRFRPQADGRPHLDRRRHSDELDP